MQPAAAIATADEHWLVTHAGLTQGFWRRALDAPADARVAARALNSFAGRHDRVLFAAGQMLGGGAPDLDAGPVWASAATELVPSWLGTDLPFSQVHGHSTIVDRRRQLRCTPEVAEHLTVAELDAHETVTLPGGRLVGVDPGHGRRPHRSWRAFVLDDAEVVT